MVLDASAIIALVLRETGYEAVTDVLARGDVRISAVNASEALTRLQRVGLDPRHMREAMERLGIDIIDFDADDATLAAELAPKVRDLGLSLGDRACLALGRRLGVAVVTADRAWAERDLGVEVVLIR